jgi:hypothetical protein
MVYGSGFWCLGFRCVKLGAGSMAYEVGCRVYGGCIVSGVGCKVQGLGLWLTASVETMTSAWSVRTPSIGSAIPAVCEMFAVTDAPGGMLPAAVNTWFRVEGMRFGALSLGSRV